MNSFMISVERCIDGPLSLPSIRLSCPFSSASLSLFLQSLQSISLHSPSYSPAHCIAPLPQVPSAEQQGLLEGHLDPAPQLTAFTPLFEIDKTVMRHDRNRRLGLKGIILSFEGRMRRRMDGEDGEKVQKRC